MTCKACPFALTELSESIQNLGCLPSPHEIFTIKRETNKNWSCHEDETKICAGYVQWIKEENLNLDYKSGSLASYNKWYHEGVA